MVTEKLWIQNNFVSNEIFWNIYLVYIQVGHSMAPPYKLELDRFSVKQKIQGEAESDTFVKIR